MEANLSYIATLDIGTTTIRCQLIDSQVKVVSYAAAKVTLLYPAPGYVEIDPNDLWETIQTVIKNAISDAGLTSSDIKCLGISTHRGTFVTWQKDTGKPFHNLITWKDMRAKELIQERNKNFMFTTFRMAAYMTYLLTRNKRYLMASDLRMTTEQCASRLLWVLENIPAVWEQVHRQNFCFGTLDTWLILKLTGSKLFVTEVSNASSTGLFDPFIMEWSFWPKLLLDIPPHIYPPVVSTDYDFGCTECSIFGNPIPIKSIIADQQASMFASSYFSQNDLKVTLGTGGFIDLDTKDKPHASVSHIYPLIGWQLGDETKYVAEAACNDVGSLIQWILDLEMLEDPKESAQLAMQVDNTDGVYFIPAFSGLGPPFWDNTAASGFLGVKPTTRKPHLVRAVLESIVYRIVLTYAVLKSERPEHFSRISVDGGVSNNDFVCQMLADMSGLEVIRFMTHELSTIGAALIAGINLGLFKTRSTDNKFEVEYIKDTFRPSTKSIIKERYADNLNHWLKAAERYKNWS